MNILAIIPARSGSKSVPHKNIRELCGKPMIAYSIAHALSSKYINRVIVSTDSEKYADISRRYGAEVPFIRPAEYATDEALDLDVFKHALNYLKDHEGYEADIVVQLRPTYPIRRVEDIDRMIEICMSEESIDSVRSMSKATEVPYKMWVEELAELNQDISLSKPGDVNISESSKVGIMRVTPLIKDIPECYNMPRQQLPTV
ncbi:MAG: acylneuraminate cytidylyltransferase family protein, partial [Lachnospiraceae bacterium]|nr:acylneuraminate cytidylyltransferase family protein [Lachnospiraceae bacterium]